MNIFAVHSNPAICARQHADKHCVKMIVEYAQLMSAAYHSVHSPLAPHLYRLTHWNHPCCKWVRASRQNYEWLFQLFSHLLDEYTHRYGKVHKTSRLASILQNAPDLPDIGRTPFAQAMPFDIRCDDPIEAYRLLYATRKRHLLVWTERRMPRWLEDYGYKEHQYEEPDKPVRRPQRNQTRHQRVRKVR